MPLDSSPENTDGVDPNTVDPPSDVKATAESSNADAPDDKSGNGEKGDMLDAVKAALGKSKEESPASEGTDPKSESDEPDKADKEGDKGSEDEDDFTDEEFSQLKAKTRRQFEKRNARIKELSTEVEGIKPKAEQFDRIVQFVDEAGLAPTEVNELFDIGRNLKVDPRKAYEQIKPVFSKLQQMFGDVLPDDLQQQVNQGHITEAYARELANSRTEAAIAHSKAERLAHQDEARRQTQAIETQVNGIKAKVTEWETSKEKTDPDWSLKQPYVMQAIENALMKRRFANQGSLTEAEALQIADKALADVNTSFARLAPKRKEIRTITDTASTQSKAAPTTALEAARAGLAKVRAA